MSNEDIFFVQINSVFIIFFCFFSIIQSSFKYFSDRGIPNFLVAARKAFSKTEMLNLNDNNLHENPLEISMEDMVAAAPSFNVIEEDEDDDIELDIM